MLSDPANGALYLFLNRRRNILKILYWDRNGFCLWQKRLEKHKFPWPRIESHRQELTIAKFEDHLPLYRQERIFKRLRVELPRATMSNWLVHIGKLTWYKLTLTQYFDLGSFDLIIAEPPYTREDADKYGIPMVRHQTVIKEAFKILELGGVLVWLDQVWPNYSKQVC